MKHKVTVEDYNSSSKGYFDARNCSLAVAMKRILGREDVFVGKSGVYSGPISEKMLNRDNQIGSIIPGFSEENYKDLRDKGIEHEFEYIPLK